MNFPQLSGELFSRHFLACLSLMARLPIPFSVWPFLSCLSLLYGAVTRDGTLSPP